MPAFLTHYIFADQLLKKDDRYRQVTILGSQGSDPFFFYGYRLLGKRKKTLENREFGTTIHHFDLSIFLDFMFEKIKTLENTLEKEVLTAYLKGFLMHYSVDRNCHPYVFYRSGFAKKKAESKKYTFIHSLFESRVDYLYKNLNGYKRIGPRKPERIKNKYLKIISFTYYEFAKNILKNDDIFPLSFFHSVKDMKTTNTILYSHTGLKKKIFEKYFKFSLVNSMSTPKRVKDDEKVDYLNLKHREWKHPVSGLVSNKSFPELVKLAEKDYKTSLELFECSIDEVVSKKIKMFVKKIDHDGCVVNSSMVYFDCFFKDKFQ
ncbi:MAG: hypothetical protein WDA35_02645 [Bacilli bacterium]